MPDHPLHFSALCVLSSPHNLVYGGYVPSVVRVGHADGDGRGQVLQLMLPWAPAPGDGKAYCLLGNVADRSSVIVVLVSHSPSWRFTFLGPELSSSLNEGESPALSSASCAQNSSVLLGSTVTQGGNDPQQPFLPWENLYSPILGTENSGSTSPGPQSCWLGSIGFSAMTKPQDLVLSHCREHFQGSPDGSTSQVGLEAEHRGSALQRNLLIVFSPHMGSLQKASTVQLGNWSPETRCAADQVPLQVMWVREPISAPRHTSCGLLELNTKP